MNAVEKQMLVFYYLGKMVEGGLITNGAFQLTGKGFDFAYDLFKTGAKLTLVEMQECLMALGNSVPPDQLGALSSIMFEIQEDGYDKVMEKVNNLKKSEENGN